MREKEGIRNKTLVGLKNKPCSKKNTPVRIISVKNTNQIKDLEKANLKRLKAK